MTFHRRRAFFFRALLAYCAGGGLLLLLGVAGCSRKSEESAVPAVAEATAQTSASCRECHAEIHRAWSATDHALANRPVHPEQDRAALAELTGFEKTGPDLILGHKPLWQPLIPGTGGRWQPHEMAYDPEKKEWFNVFGAEQRRAGEWGHWTGRGMNWNSMCAHCHMTGYRRNYDARSDTYDSKWVEQGIGCIQCHGAMPADHGRKGAAARPATDVTRDRQRAMQTCAPCHARNELLTDRFQPGDLYADHFRATLPVDAATFYPDGQQRDEVFNWTSVLLSRMGHAGVTCLDCHDAHTARTILPVSNNQLCQQCHAAPGRVMPGGARAVPIDPVAHSHHAPGSAGNSCVACHMPTTTYMQRAARHDHGWLKPDPLLTKELGIPNACSTCHSDRPVEWAIAQADAWYGRKLDSRQRARARAIAAAQAGDPVAADALRRLLGDEDIPAWRATYLDLLGRVDDGDVAAPDAVKSLRASDPLERAAAVRFLSRGRAATELLTPMLDDPVRVVRLDAAWTLSPQLAPESAARKELDAYLQLTIDQPWGRVRLAQDLANRGEFEQAMRHLEKAVEWDPYSPGIRETQGEVLAAAGRLAEAGNAFYRAAELSGARGASLALRAGLAFAEAEKAVEAENAFRLALRVDGNFHRAAYNLGLLFAQQENLPAAATALQQAESIAPRVVDYPYALSTVLVRAGDLDGARAAARRALQIEPGHAGARQILERIGGGR